MSKAWLLECLQTFKENVHVHCVDNLIDSHDEEDIIDLIDKLGDQIEECL